MIRIVVTSDLHCKFDEVEIPECDILIDCGDYSFRGQNKEIKDFYTWFNKQPAKHLVSIQGNHELGPWRNPSHTEIIIKEICPRVHWLHDSSVVLEGIKIYGSPWQPEFCNWAYNLPRGIQLKEKWDLIPEDTDILVTHGPPYQILDEVQNYDGFENVGCMDLRDKVDKLSNLKYHFFGHLHYNGGKIMGLGNTTFGNAAINDDSYNVKNKPLVIEYEFLDKEGPENDCQ